jgi:hypothetical protein
VSLPPLPIIWSAPPRPLIRSPSAPPVKVSAPAPPSSWKLPLVSALPSKLTMLPAPRAVASSASVAAPATVVLLVVIE